MYVLICVNCLIYGRPNEKFLVYKRARGDRYNLRNAYIHGALGEGLTSEVSSTSIGCQSFLKNKKQTQNLSNACILWNNIIIINIITVSFVNFNMMQRFS